MKDGERMSLDQIRAFLEANKAVEFKATSQRELYEWTTRTLCAQEYAGLGRSDKGLVRRYVAKRTGLSRAQVTRLISQYAENGTIKVRRNRGRCFTAHYNSADIVLLALVDEAHDTLSGPATQKILYREYFEFADARYERLANISVARIYNLRKHRSYREKRMVFHKTRPTPVSIGERRRPEPEGRPGYLRIDTVHQGDLDGVKGVYHINAVDKVTQWQIVGATPHISEAWLKPLLESMLAQFPFRILGFHSDNGSELVNHTVAELLEQTADRADQVAPAALQRQRTGGVEERRGDPQTHGVRSHLSRSCGQHQCLLSGVLQPLSESSPALRSSGAEEGQQGQDETHVPVVRNTRGDLSTVARNGPISEGRSHHRTTGTNRRSAERYRRRKRNAAS